MTCIKECRDDVSAYERGLYILHLPHLSSSIKWQQKAFDFRLSRHISISTHKSSFGGCRHHHTARSLAFVVISFKDLFSCGLSLVHIYLLYRLLFLCTENVPLFPVPLPNTFFFALLSALYFAHSTPARPPRKSHRKFTWWWWWWGV